MQVISRRTIAALTVVAALAGGTAGGVAVSVSHPADAQAQEPIKTLGKAKTDRQLLELTRAETLQTAALVKQMNAKIDALVLKNQQYDRNWVAVVKLLKSPSGVTVSNMVEQILVSVNE